MKKILCLLVAVLPMLQVNAQRKVSGELNEYRRSSICMIMIDEDGMPYRDTIKRAFLELPIPDKYNDHSIGERIFSTDTMTITPEDEVAYEAAMLAGAQAEKVVAEAMEAEEATGDPKKKGKFGKMLGGLAKGVVKGAASDLSGGLIDTTSKEDYAIKTYKYLTQHKVAKQLFDRWFVTPEGTLTLDTMFHRGLYDATVQDVEVSEQSSMGHSMLQDAGKELVGNTFVVVTRYRYMSKDELVASIVAMAQVAAEAAGASDYASLGGAALATTLKASLGDGYYVRTISYLFQLNWNDTVFQQFAAVAENKEAYDAADFYRLNYIGKETGWSQVKEKAFSNKPEEELIAIATRNATDEVLAKLERKYDVFKTKTPLATVDPYFSAKIGMKEGIKAGDKFDVLERSIDPKTNLTVYKRVGTLKVMKDYVWDNRYMATEEREVTGETQDFDATRFEGTIKDAHTGMLLRLKKSK